jgi:DNA repair protein RadD
MISLRPYQERILCELRVALRAHRSVLICSPCGSGKGSLISYMVNGAVARNKRVIFAVHGKTLVQDMSERVSRLGIQHGVLMGGKRREHWHPVQVASIDTLHRMQHRPKCDLLILDEARTFLSARGRQVVEDYKDSLIVGADATPARLDGKGLGVEAGGIFEAMIMGPNEQDLIDIGFLVPSIPIGIEEPPDTSKVEKTGGDFNQKQLAAVCDKVKLVGNIVQHWKKHAAGLKTVAFAVDQAHAKHITEEFRKESIEWEYVDASTPDDERARIWHRLDHGTLMGFSNVGVAGVGFDHPCISCVIAARPTASLSLWRQMIGRASRPYPGKKFWILLDHSGSLIRHYPFGFFETPPVWSLDGTVAKPRDGDPKPPPVATCKIPVRVPESGVPAFFRGPLSPDGKWMLGSYHTFRAGPDICPYCGLPLLVQTRDIDVEDGDLKDLSSLREAAKVEAKVKSAEQIAVEEKKKARYFELVKIGRNKGYKNGWPALAYKIEHKGVWPQKGWKKEAEAIYGPAPVAPPSAQESFI